MDLDLPPQVLDHSPVFGSFLIGSCIVFMTFVVLNLFISVILVAFSEEQKCSQVSPAGLFVDPEPWRGWLTSLTFQGHLLALATFCPGVEHCDYIVILEGQGTQDYN